MKHSGVQWHAKPLATVNLIWAALACAKFAPMTRGEVPLPTARQLEFLELETIQFMHFGIPTFWTPSDAFLHGANPTVGGNCQPKVTGTSNDSQTEGYWPCLNPNIFAPEHLDVEQWMEASAALGMREICLTAKHFGGFTLWPSNHTPYGVQAATKWRGGHGDVLREFADAANRWGIKICYYCNPRDDGYLAQFGNVDPAEFESRQLGMLSELMDSYGPVNRFWFDGGPAEAPPNPDARPLGTNTTVLYQKAFALIRERSPPTLISPYHGDICSSTQTLYTSSAPRPNSTDPTGCTPADEAGHFFHPNELHGITMQEGPDGNTDASPTYWFWRPWACAGNVSGCPWVGHANASRIFDGYIATVGHGGVLNMNIPPDNFGRMNTSVVSVMREAGEAINDTFHLNNAGTVSNVGGQCGPGVVTINVTGEFDYIVTMEDMRRGQRIGNYSVEFRRRGSRVWETLVPCVGHNSSAPPALGDRPDGHDPRDSHVGQMRIDTPVVPTSGPSAVDIAQVRFTCHRLIQSAQAEGQLFLRRFSVHRKRAAWEQSVLAAPSPLAAPRPPTLAQAIKVSLIKRFPSWAPCSTVELSKDGAEPIANTLYLNLANTGATPLYTGKTMWGTQAPTPVITLSFELGNGTHDLTCMYPTRTDPHCPLAPGGISAASAWNIVPGISVDYTGGWHAAGSGSTDPAPVFRLKPTNTNQDILGICPHGSGPNCTGRNVTFSFSEIVAYTPVGVTQMTLKFAFFPYDDQTFYDDATFTVNITKETGSGAQGC